MRADLVVEQFGKSFLDILGLKQSFFDANAALLARAEQHAALYVAQPRREACKVCDERLSREPLLTKSGIGYALCGRCGHLNGLHEDTDEFAMEVYANRGGKDYAANYTPADLDAYQARCDAIYAPKVRFLGDVLREYEVHLGDQTVADMGAGAGYFVKALRDRGMGSPPRGFELGEALVDLASWVMPDAPVQRIELHDVEAVTANVDASLLSFIGVFEHLQRLRGTLAAVQENPHARWLYTCVPMYAPTVFNEAVFPGVMPRHLTGGHTHLFTHSSLAHLEEEFGLQRLGAWWFGTDVMDYFRSVGVSLAGQPEAAEAWYDMYAPLVDPIQLAIDQARASSQVHLVYAIR